MDALQAALRVAGSGLAAQSARLRVVSENMANVQSTGTVPGADPYRRKTVTFASELDQLSGMDLVQVKDVGTDPTAFSVEHDPGNPAADSDGNVKMPNVNMIAEMTDMRETNRSYEADLQVIKQSRDLIAMTIDLLKGSS
ncbi:flagellar basal body rod protein FlgC [Lichenihabitans sp. Uapishka_5]|uniref:flagellar basal body rod protein FlgC n=1 Tax=Lichenihabitans sp. Uapishka_5 TaxID=3037302 RepID=UPI0029E80C7B|nr:flagellar basal body rod protein FlgC [Lichenihabitans sp. Uapishka_5]MDX7952989.1 flagellar basal body rod protein FlgC [Lichenihabitans sp. Uapishka_5]